MDVKERLKKAAAQAEIPDVLDKIKERINAAPVEESDAASPRAVEIRGRRAAPPTGRRPIKNPVGLFAAAAILVFAFAWLIPGIIEKNAADNAVYATISIDINPAFELTTNKDGRVLALSAKNGDAAPIVRNIDSRSKTLADIIPQIIDGCVSGGYLAHGEGHSHDIFVTVTLPPGAVGDEWKSEIERLMTACCENHDMNVTINFA
ncbi:MAG: hypothetical protein LBP26_07395 [Clostridiales bacterium]|jgi:hypothetical protein|nr:hypothetical protein [Clostridiales bacterium]